MEKFYVKYPVFISSIFVALLYVSVALYFMFEHKDITTFEELILPPLKFTGYAIGGSIIIAGAIYGIIESSAEIFDV